MSGAPDPRRDVILTGIGGQGVQLCAKVLAQACVADGHHVMLSSYFGGEMRGGRTEATVVRATRPSSTCHRSCPASTRSSCCTPRSSPTPRRA